MMKKNKVVTFKSIAAKAWKAAVEADRAAREAKQKEDEYWREAEGPKSRAAKKREEKALKKAETAEKKYEIRRLVEQEKKELEERLLKGDRKSLFRVTQAELALQKEKEEAEFRRIAKEEKKKASRVLDEEEYAMMLSMPNVNRNDSIIEARTVEDALAYLTATGMESKVFEEVIKIVKHGVAHNQCKKDLVRKLLKGDAENLDKTGKCAVKVKSRVVARRLSKEMVF